MQPPSTKWGHLCGHIVEIACRDQEGSRTVQQALEEAEWHEKTLFVQEICGHTWSMVLSPHGNYVISFAIQSLPTSAIAFIIEELSVQSFSLMRHQYGCRIFQRLLEHHCSSEHASPRVAQLADYAVNHAAMLSREKYGNYAVQSLLEHGTPKHKSDIASALLRDGLLKASTDAYASNVVRKCLEHCSEHDQNALIKELLKDAHSMRTLSQSSAGDHVLKQLQSGAHVWKVINQGVPEQHETSIEDFHKSVHISSDQRDRSLRSIRGKLVDLVCANRAWSIAVQDAIKVHKHSDSSECIGLLTTELRGRVTEVLQSPNGNFIVCSAIETFSAAFTEMISAEIGDAALEVCTHQYGYKAMISLMKSKDGHWHFEQLLGRLMDCAVELACNKFGNFVIQAALSYTKKRQRKEIIGALRSEMRRLADDEFGRHVWRALHR
jgi:hypothetical protein